MKVWQFASILESLLCQMCGSEHVKQLSYMIAILEVQRNDTKFEYEDADKALHLWFLQSRADIRIDLTSKDANVSFTFSFQW